MKRIEINKKIIAILIFSLFVFSGCGLALKEKPEEIKNMEIDKLYNLAIDYYSNGLLNEAEFLYKKVIEKYENLQEKSEKDKYIYLWSLYEVGFINYLKDNYKEAKNYFNKVIHESESQTTPQTILAKKILLKIKAM